MAKESFAMGEFAWRSRVQGQGIKSITQMEVRDTTAEIEPTIGSVVQIFTTDTVGEEFLLAAGGPAGTRARAWKWR
jgi:hypothetical protein